MSLLTFRSWHNKLNPITVFLKKSSSAFPPALRSSSSPSPRRQWSQCQNQKKVKVIQIVAHENSTAKNSAERELWAHILMNGGFNLDWTSSQNYGVAIKCWVVEGRLSYREECESIVSADPISCAQEVNILRVGVDDPKIYWVLVLRFRFFRKGLDWWERRSRVSKVNYHFWIFVTFVWTASENNWITQLHQAICSAPNWVNNHKRAHGVYSMT